MQAVEKIIAVIIKTSKYTKVVEGSFKKEKRGEEVKINKLDKYTSDIKNPLQKVLKHNQL